VTRRVNGDLQRRAERFALSGRLPTVALTEARLSITAKPNLVCARNYGGHLRFSALIGLASVIPAATFCLQRNGPHGAAFATSSLFAPVLIASAAVGDRSEEWPHDWQCHREYVRLDSSAGLVCHRAGRHHFLHGFCIPPLPPSDSRPGWPINTNPSSVA
jgi:hypothetical protein